MKNIQINSIKRLLVLYLILVFSEVLSAQNFAMERISTVNNQGNDGLTSLISRQTEFLRESYAEKNEAPEELINGKEYESYYTRSKVKPLLFPEKTRTASAITKTRRYDNLSLQYDTFLDQVIYTDTSKTINFRFPQIALNKNIIDGFNLYFSEDSLIFRNFRKPEYTDSNLKEGFYEVAYEGSSRYLIRHESSFYEREGLVNYKYSRVDYISTGNAFCIVKNKKSLLRLMDEKSKEVRKFLHASGVRVRQADKNQIITVVKYYDSLISSRQK